MPHSSPSAVAGGSTPMTTRVKAVAGDGRRRARCLEQRARPQRALDILDQLAEQLLAAEPGAAVDCLDHGEEGLAASADCRSWRRR